MLITKFNAMIRSRILWGGFAVIVCVSFVGGSLSMRGCRKTQTGNVIATIGDREISIQDFRLAQLFELNFDSPGRLSETEKQQLEDSAWKRMATLEFAKSVGVATTQKEIDAIITSDPRLQVNGVFDPELYARTIMRDKGVSVDIFEQYMAETITLQKMAAVASAMVLTPPSELSQKLERLTDIVEVDYAVIKNEQNSKKIKVSDDELKACFERNIDLFRIPEKMNVKYVTFPINSYTSSVNITEQMARDYYSDHISDYSWSDTNDDLVTIEFKDAQQEITSKLIWDQSTLMARDDATEFVMDLMPERDGTTVPLENVLATNSLTIHTSDYFSAYENIDGIDAGYEFNKTAFKLVPGDPEESVSEAIVGTSNVYVAIAGKKIDSRLPSFEEVKEEVEPFAKNRKASELFDDQAKQVRKELLEDMAKGKTFKDLLEDEDIEVFSTEPFSVFSDMTNEIENSEAIVPTAVELDAGEVSELIPSPDGYMLIHVKDRQKGDVLSAELMRPNLASALSRHRASIIYYDMQDQLVAQTVVKKKKEPSDSPDEDESNL